jgi:leukotriene-A4 hydrolase
LLTSQRFKGKTLTSDDFKQFFCEHFAAKDLSQIDWDAWFYTPGMPPVDTSVNYDTTLAESSIALATKWTSDDTKECAKGDLEGWTTPQIVLFLEKCQSMSASKDGPRPTTMSVALLDQMDELYSLTASRNSEIRFRWQTLCIRAGREIILPHVVAFLKEQGRMKFLRPLYKELNKNGERDVAMVTFHEMRDKYHPIAAKVQFAAAAPPSSSLLPPPSSLLLPPPPSSSASASAFSSSSLRSPLCFRIPSL